MFVYSPTLRAHGVGGVRGPANAPPPPGPLQNYAFWICIMCGNICIEAKPNTVQKHSHWEIVIDLCLLLSWPYLTHI